LTHCTVQVKNLSAKITFPLTFTLCGSQDVAC
jgi:hypothetical protein